MTNRYQSRMPIPHQGANRQAHPDGYNSDPIAAGNQNAAYGSPNQQNPNGFRVEVSFPNQRPDYYASGQNVYGGGPGHQASNGHQANHQRFTPRNFGAVASGYYGNPVVIRVSDSNWIDALDQAVDQGQSFELIFDAENIVQELVRAVENEIGSWASAVERWGRDLWNRIFSAGLAYPNPNVPAQALVAPAVVAAIAVVAVAVVVAVVAIYNIHASRRIAERMINRNYSIDINTSGEGSGEGSWFDFLTNSRWVGEPGTAQ